MGMVLMLICAMMTSISIAREKEKGTMEVLLVSPMRPLLIILAKAVPYLALSVINLTTILILSVFVLGVPIAGSLFWLVIVSVVFIFLSLALGLLISSAVSTQSAALLISGMALMMPIMLLSGMMFPVENMPLFLQIISDVIPARWYISAVKKLMIKGLGVASILKELAILSGMTLFILAASLKRFKVRLE
jgi:ABC-2 type transport system permease protein